MPKYVMHAYKTEDDAPLRINLGDTWYDLPTNEPVEITGPDADFMAQKLVELYGPVYGLIEVASHKTRSGTQIDIDAAEAQCKKALRAHEDLMLANWVRTQQEERLKINLPVLPPRGRVQQIIEERKIDLQAKYGFRPVGYDYTPTPGATADNSALLAENAELKAKLAANDDRLTKLMAHMGVTDDEIKDAKA